METPFPYDNIFIMKNKDIEFLRTERLQNYWENYARSFEPPFSRWGFLIEFLVRIFRNTAIALEGLCGRNIYVKKADSDFDRIPPRFHSLVKRLGQEGILKQVLFPKPISDWPRIPALNLKFGNGASASGYALDWDMAATKAVAELLEWSAFGGHEKKNFIFGTWNDLKSKGAVDPKRFIAFSEKQLVEPEYAGHRINDGSKFSWTRCFSLFDGKEYWAPAQLVFFGSEIFSGEPKIRQTTTNGGAAGTSITIALVHGLLEAIERDALMIHWLNKITPPRVDLESLAEFNNENINKILGEYKKYDIDFSLLDITTDLEVPVFLTVIRDQIPGRPAVFLGAGADLDAESAIIHSLLEGLRAGYWRDVSEEQIAEVNKKAPLIENLEERRAYWCDKSRMPEADFLLNGPMKKIKRNEFCGADNQKKLERLKQILRARGMEAYGVDCTTKAAEGAGLKIIMTLVPELYYLYLNERFKYLGSKRLYEAPVKMGVFKQPKKEEEMNSIPHPML